MVDRDQKEVHNTVGESGKLILILHLTIHIIQHGNRIANDEG